MKPLYFSLAGLWALSFGNFASAAGSPSKPNIIYILCDDLGYGDVHALNTDGKIATPHMDKLAAEGMIFTDAHSSSAVCSPTRYGVMTGRYNWRSRLQSSVLGGLSPRLIEPNRMTVASLLKEHGYATACIGKWHLGMDWVKLEGKDVSEVSIETPEQVHNVDYSKPILNGPNSVGFDYYYGISASLDMVPYAFIENDHTTSVPTEDMKFPLMEGRKDNGTRLGPGVPGFTTEAVLPTLTKKVVDVIGKHAADAKSGKPFFIYLPLNAPHTPIAPTPEWQGKSGLNPYGDYVMETDWAIGRVMEALKKNGIADNTLLILTSDNGCSPQAKFDELKAKGHNPSYVFRGTKADIYDGGHHIPFIVRWPGVVKQGGKYAPYVCLTDFMATVAEILGVKLPDNAGEDSVSMLPVLKGQTQEPIRDAIVHHSITGAFSIRQGGWKLELCPGSAGWSDPRPGKEAKDAPRIQLYDMNDDIAEANNVQAQHPDIVEKLTKLLQKYVADGRSTPGTPQQNTVTPDIFSGEKEVNIKKARKAKPD
jgi:arylsulfatase A-like enzyme